MKKYLIFAASALALASCSSDDFLGENPGNVQNATTAINFGGEAGKTTRGIQRGSTAADILKNHFVVFGDKTNAAGTQAVYDHYDVQWIGDGDDKKTQTNQHGWEYVGYKPNKNSSLATDAKQSIKYWDYSATEYNFAAFSLGELTSQTENNPYENQVDKNATTIGSGKVKISQIESKATKYTIEGSAEAITKLYISDRVTAKPSNATKPDIKYKDAVEFNFRALKSQVRMGIFEIIPGYSVKDVKFYSFNTSTPATDTPRLYATTKSIPAGEGKATVTFGASGATDYNKAKVEWEAQNNVENITFEALSKKKEEAKEEAGTTYIGRTANDASLPTNYTTVIPSTGIGALTLKVDYTLVSTDGSNEKIKVTGATATVPSEYTQWQPNYSYTYIFKISDKTNGNTGDPTKPGLYPIVFDAVVTETENGIQNTITTEETPPITTYAKGNVDNNEYKSTDNIYASVTYETTGMTAALYDANGGRYEYYAKLYKLTAGNNITEAEAEAVINATGMTLGGKSLEENGTYDTNTLDPHFVDKIAKEDATDGVEISGNFFKFKVEPGTYVFAYKKGEEKSYKVIKVAATTVAP
ncbi:MAG: hypothetical protein MR541_06175 [Prevotella sp.]|nr:hypothetical protein [Prevotella sp.]